MEFAKKLATNHVCASQIKNLCVFDIQHNHIVALNPNVVVANRNSPNDANIVVNQRIRQIGVDGSICRRVLEHTFLVTPFLVAQKSVDFTIFRLKVRIKINFLVKYLHFSLSVFTRFF